MFLLLSWLFYKSLLLGLIISPALLFFENMYEKEVEHIKKQKWEEKFSKYLEDLDSHIRLGHSMEYSTKQSIKESEFLQSEKWMIEELELNVYVSDVFQKLAEKKKIESLTQFAGVLDSALKSGSNLHDLMQNSIQQIQKRIKMEEEIQSMLTKVKYESRILVVFVPFLLIYLKSLSPNFSRIMYQGLYGRFIMTICLGIYLLASYFCYSMTKAEI